MNSLQEKDQLDPLSFHLDKSGDFQSVDFELKPSLSSSDHENQQEYKKEQTQKNDRIASFDGLRVICSLIVMFHHLDILLPGLSHAKIESERKILWSEHGEFEWSGFGYIARIINGWLSVIYFLLMVGYLYSYKIFQGLPLQSILSGLSRRFFRIIPSLIPLHIFLLLLYKYRVVYWNLTPDDISNCYFKSGLYGVFCSLLNGPTYILPLLTFSPFFVALVLLFLHNQTLKIKIIVYSIVLGYLVWVEDTTSFYFPVVCGMLVADINHSSNFAQIKNKILTQKHFKVIFAIVWALQFFIFKFTNATKTIAATLTLFPVIHSKHLSKILGHKYFTLVVPYTYQVYIWHVPIYKLYINYFNDSSFIFLVFFAFLTIFVISVISYHFVEKPCLVHGTKFINWIGFRKFQYNHQSINQKISEKHN